MALQIINVGAAPNDGTGDPIRDAYIKCNDNFGLLNNRAQSIPPSNLIGTVGDQAGMYAYDNTYFYYCFADYDGSSVIWGQVTQIGNISVTQILNGTSSIDVLGANSNIAVTVDSTSNVAVFTNAGIETANIAVSGNASIDGVLTTVGNANVRHIIPSANVTYDLGSPTRKFRTLYVGGNTIYLDTSTITANSTSITLSSGSGASFTVSGDSAANTLGAFGLVSATGNIEAGNVISAGIITATGNIVTSGYFIGTFLGNITGNFVVPGSSTQILYNTLGNADASSNFTWNDATKVLYVNGLASATGNIIGGNITTNGHITATGNILAGNLISGNAVTSVGNITGGNIITAGLVSATGNVQGNYILGNGALLSGITSYGNADVANYLPTYSGNLAGDLISVSGNVTGGNVSAAGNVMGGNILTLGLASITGNITAGNIFSSGTANVGNLLTPGIVSASGNVQSSNIITGGLITATGNIQGGNIITGGLITATGNIQGGNIITGGSISATANVQVGNLSTSGLISATGNIIAGNISTTGVLVVNTNNAATAIINGGSNASGNIGSTSKYFNTVYATATTALYADLAECYAADNTYEPGTVLKFGGPFEVTVSDHDMDVAVAGVVSTQPAYKMNAGLQANNVVIVALAGRVPCRVQGTVRKGQMMVSAGNGRARAETAPIMGSVIGKALQDHDGDLGVIEIVVGRL